MAFTSRWSDPLTTLRCEDDADAVVAFEWCGEPLEVQLERSRAGRYQAVEVLWTAGRLGLTFGTDAGFGAVVVKRATPGGLGASAGVRPGHQLVAANDAAVDAATYDETMLLISTGVEAGLPQRLRFLPPPAPFMVRSLPTHGALAAAGVSTDHALARVNGVATQYMSVDDLDAALRQASKPCVLSFVFVERPRARSRASSQPSSPASPPMQTALLLGAISVALCT
ncbi:hypothetical protein ACHHYP_04561 [Achlya hypogyna]|uniref:PDZ domain-containing protein n=1 Tax=Achlya hypogyna TaxID=1202772 RepID=A0A1V9Z0R4_ACHHY|nr:hypothetical protein ACHHYP_04561 [Achlya hypogyna]